MAAYAALISLVHFLHPDQYPNHFRTPEIESLYSKARSLQSSLEKIHPVPKDKRDDVNKFETQIRDEIYRALDIIESFIFNQNPTSPPTFQHDLQDVIAKIGPAEVELKKIADSIKDDWETTNWAPDMSSYSASSIEQRTKIVGRKKDLERVTKELKKDDSKLQVLSIVGLPGIGKTTLARSIYENPRVQSDFTTRAWVTVSEDSQKSEIYTKLLKSIETKSEKAGSTVIQADASVDDLRNQLSRILKGAVKYLVVVDDMWDTKVWDEIRPYLPDDQNGSRIILTTQLVTIADYAMTGFQHVVEPLSKEKSWKLLCRRALGGETCHDNLVKTGTMIAENCRGIPLLLTVIGGLLSQGREEEKYWKSIADDTFEAAAKDKEYADKGGKESYFEILSLSYNHLQGEAKACFLYMGAFPEDSEILVNKITKLWVAEGFLKPTDQNMDFQVTTSSSLPPRTEEQVAKHFIGDLIKRNLLSTRKWTSNGHTKAFGMHDSIRNLAVKICQREKFFHAINRYIKKDDLPEGADNQRRLSVHKNFLMCMKEVYESAKLISSARTLLHVGPYHHHPLPFTLTFNLLRVLDALTVYFIEFPNEIVDLIFLRFLSLTYNGKLPPSISKLQKLQTLIVHRNPKTIFIGSSYFPAEIWNMPELRHLLFMECELPKTPTNKPVLLQHLQSLSNVRAASCTEEVLKNMPMLRKLGMWVEKPGPVKLYIHVLQYLEAFKFTVLNPSPQASVEFGPNKLDFPKTLKKLTLSGCGIPWEDMKVIGKLQLLEVLKLRELACKGGKWKPELREFPKLKYLLLEYADLKTWSANSTHFRSLETLILRHCYELEKMDSDIRHIGRLKLIEMVDCSPYAVEWANNVKKKIIAEQPSVNIFTSWK